MKKRFVGVWICIFTLCLLVGSAKAAENLTIYVDDGNADYLAELIVSGENNAESLIALLVEHEMIPEGTLVNYFQEFEQDDLIIGELDLSKEYEDAMNQTGTAGETMYIYSVVNTFIKNLGLDEVKLTSDGEVISTGHAIYNENLTFYDHIIEASEWNENVVIAQSTVEDTTGKMSVVDVIEPVIEQDLETDEGVNESVTDEAVQEETNSEVEAANNIAQDVIKEDEEGITSIHRVVIFVIFGFAMLSLLLCVFVRVGKRKKI